MKIAGIILAVLSLLALAGCASTPRTAEVAVQRGMSREDLRMYFGEPLRIEPGAAGGEDWYYRFASWETAPAGATETHEEFGEKISSVSVGLQFSRNTEARPVHVSAEGYVVGPLPKGKVVTDR